MSEKEIDEVSGVQTTGHEWDGIRELDNPMPRWWLWTFYACILFAVGYCIYYPAIPLLTGATPGTSGFSTRADVARDMQQAKASKAALMSQIEAMPLEDIRNNDALYRFAVSAGKSNFKVYCSQCHGSGAQGAPGYPNLNDDDWIWGGDLASIYTTISHGVRSTADDETRVSEMPAFGRDGILKSSQIKDTAEYVLKLSNQAHNERAAARGAAVFAENCVACHGADGKGGREVGAPNLTDSIWLYGGSREEIVSQVTQSKHGVMPSWLPRLGEASVKQLAIYVHSLGGGEKAKVE